MDVVSGDIDGDGDRDLILAMEFARNAILVNNGKGIFTDGTSERLPNIVRDSEDITLVDLDGDGDLDLLFVSEDDFRLAPIGTDVHECYMNDGKGVFTLAPHRLQESESNAIAAGDLDRDGDPDIVMGNSGQMWILVNDGSGMLSNQSATRLPMINGLTQDVQLVDIDRDGDLDILDGNEFRLRIFVNNGTGVFADETSQRLPQTTRTETRKIVPHDVDNDGDVDLYYCNVAWIPTCNPQDRLYRNDGNGFFTDVTATNLPPSSVFTLDAAFIDVDGDGDKDLLTLHFPKKQPVLHLNDGAGVFTVAPDTLLPPLPEIDGLAIHVSDVNMDGHDDIYIGNRGGNDVLLLSQITTSVRTPAETGRSSGFLHVPANDDWIRLVGRPGDCVVVRIHDLVGREIHREVMNIPAEGETRIQRPVIPQPLIVSTVSMCPEPTVP